MFAAGLMLRAPDFLEHGGPPTASVRTKYITVLRLISRDRCHHRCFVVSPTFRTEANNKAVCTVSVYTCHQRTKPPPRIALTNRWLNFGFREAPIPRSLPDKRFLNAMKYVRFYVSVAIPWQT